MVEHPDSEDPLSETVGRHTRGSGTGVCASERVSELTVSCVSKMHLSCLRSPASSSVSSLSGSSSV